MRPFLKHGFAILLCTTLFTLMILTQKVASSAYHATIEEDDRYYLPPAGWLRLFCLGYNEAMADLIWVKTVIHFGEQTKKETAETGFVMNYLLTAVELDSRFRALYTVGSTLTMYQSQGRITRKSLDMAIQLLERGIRVFPNDGELFFSLGFIHHYEMLNFISSDPEDPITKEHLRLGRYYFSRAALMNNAPPYAALLSASLMQKWGAAEMVTAHLKAMLMKETDPKIRAELIARLRKEAGKAAERDIQMTQQLQREWKEQLPFIPYDFYLVLRTETPVKEILDPLYFTDQLLTHLNDSSANVHATENHPDNR